MKTPPRKINVPIFAQVVAALAITLLLLFQAYSSIIQKESFSPLPPLFGNFPANRAYLEKQKPKSEFSFAVVGDPKSHGIFERISEYLRRMPLDFAVLLGDCAYDGTESAHRYFRAECADEYAQPFPVFYVVGNHDVSPEHFPVSRFEKEYGPSIFSFEYQDCLFIVLRILNPPFRNHESLAFLRKFRTVPPHKYRHTFVFMHIPPPVSSLFVTKLYPEHEELTALFEEIGVEYVFAGDFHGYAHVKRGKTIYIVTGGGGAHLHDNRVNRRQFHHAFIVHVAANAISETIIPFPAGRDLEDCLESYAISEAWPWMTRNIPLVCVLDLACLVLLFIFIRSIAIHVLKRHRKKSGL